VTQVGEKISELVDVVRGEVIETATAESDVEEETWQREYEKAFGCPPPMEKLYDDEVQGMAGWYEGDVDRERELARAKAQGWIDDEPAALSLRAAAAAPPPATRTEQDAGDIGEDGDDDFSPQARFLRDRQRLQQKSIVKGAAETDASLPASRRPTDQKQKWDPPGGYGYVPKKRRPQGVAQVTSSSPAEATASAPSPTATQGRDIQVDDDDFSEQARFLRAMQGRRRQPSASAPSTQPQHAAATGAPAAGAKSAASGSVRNGAPARTVTMSRIQIDSPAKKESSKYEVRSNRGRVMEQFDTPDAQDSGGGVAF